MNQIVPVWCIGNLDAICHVRGSVDFTLLPYAMVMHLINETLVFVKNILFEKCTRFYGAFAPNPRYVLDRNFSTSNSALCGTIKTCCFQAKGPLFEVGDKLE